MHQAPKEGKKKKIAIRLKPVLLHQRTNAIKHVYPTNSSVLIKLSVKFRLHIPNVQKQRYQKNLPISKGKKYIYCADHHITA